MRKALTITSRIRGKKAVKDMKHGYSLSPTNHNGKLLVRSDIWSLKSLILWMGPDLKGMGSQERPVDEGLLQQLQFWREAVVSNHLFLIETVRAQVVARE